jgi:hypothetical protein
MAPAADAMSRDATSPDASAKAQPMSSDPATAILDRVDAFWYDTSGPVLDDAAMKSLASLADPAGTLVAVVTSPDAPLARRYVAIEALIQGGWSDWTKREDVARTAANVLAEAMPKDRMHNRWGLPGHFVGPTGKILLRLSAGVRDALVPLLDDCRPLEIIGSQEATLQAKHKYRVCDLAGYLLAQYEKKAWKDAPDAATRDQNREKLRAP